MKGGIQGRVLSHGCLRSPMYPASISWCSQSKQLHCLDALIGLALCLLWISWKLLITNAWITLESWIKRTLITMHLKLNVAFFFLLFHSYLFFSLWLISRQISTIKHTLDELLQGSKHKIIFILYKETKAAHLM